MWTTLWNTDMPWLQWAVVILASIVAAAWDLAEHRIPNVLTGLLFLAGVAWATVAGGSSGLIESLLACLILSFPYILLFAFGGGGAGDAKMMAAIGAWLGLINGLVALACVSMAGVILGIVFISCRKSLSAAGTMIGSMIVRMAVFLSSPRSDLKTCLTPQGEPLTKMPYGLAILLGVCLAGGVIAVWRG